MNTEKEHCTSCGEELTQDELLTYCEMCEQCALADSDDDEEDDEDE